MTCDVMRVELPYLCSDLPNKPRVEYILEDYQATPMLARMTLKKAFPKQEHCRDEEDLLLRIQNLLSEASKQPKEEVKPTPQPASMVQPIPVEAPKTSLSATYERIELFMADNDWTKAEQYCEQALDKAPKDPKIHLLKLLVEAKMKKIDDLYRYPQPIDTLKAYRFANMFAEKESKAKLEEINLSIKEKMKAWEEKKAAEKAAVAEAELQLKKATAEYNGKQQEIARLAKEKKDNETLIVSSAHEGKKAINNAKAAERRKEASKKEERFLRAKCISYVFGFLFLFLVFAASIGYLIYCAATGLGDSFPSSIDGSNIYQMLWVYAIVAVVGDTIATFVVTAVFAVNYRYESFACGFLGVLSLDLYSIIVAIVTANYHSRQIKAIDSRSPEDQAQKKLDGAKAAIEAAKARNAEIDAIIPTKENESKQLDAIVKKRQDELEKAKAAATHQGAYSFRDPDNRKKPA